MKITKATFKSFIRKSGQSLMIQVNSRFDGMIDGMMQCEDRKFIPVNKDEGNCQEHTLGIKGLWLVGGGRDYFTPYQENGMTGIRWSNCCGSGVLAVEGEAK